MTGSMPDEVRLSINPDNATTFDFPVRGLGGWRWFAVLPIGAGVGTVAYVIHWTLTFAHQLMLIVGPWGALSGLFAIPGILFGLGLVSFGVAAVVGRSRLIVTDEQLIAVEQVSWFSWRRPVRRDAIARLEVKFGMTGNVSGRSEELTAFRNCALLTAQLIDGKSKRLVLGYPPEWLVPVANDLSARLVVKTDVDDAPAAPIPVAVIDAAAERTGELDRFIKPPDSPVDLQQLPDGCAIVVPALGVWKGSSGLFTFALFWCGFMVVFTFGAVVVFAAGPGGDPEAKWIVPLMITLFWAIGIGMLFGAINMGRRQAALALTQGRLKTIVTSLFGVTRKEWELADLQTIRKGDSSMEVNDVPVMQLQIVPQTGQPYGLLTGRDEAEIEWIATILRQQLAIHARGDVAPAETEATASYATSSTAALRSDGEVATSE